MHLKLTVAIALTSICSAQATTADRDTQEMARADAADIEEVFVWGRAIEQKGQAQSASSGLVGYSDFTTRPLERVGELVEVVPGMVVTQHSGEGKANQYYLRGMNLDHGTDFSAFFHGMPVNLRAHAHGQGYLDLNFLIPEVISTVAFKKGPYFADRGDFSSAGTTSFNVYQRIDDPFVQLELGEHNYQRFVGAASTDLVRGHLMGALEVAYNDGPWALPADVSKHNMLLRYNFDAAEFNGDLLFTYYDNTWLATDQIPQRAVTAGLLDRFGFIDPDLGGNSQRLNLITNLQGERLEVNAYVSQYALNVYSNFTYFADDPAHGDQIEQVDRRWIYGGNSVVRFQPGSKVRGRAGIDVRVDRIANANLYQTTARVRRSARRRDAVDWHSFGLFGEITAQWNRRLRSTLGLRLDHYAFEVDAQLAANSGDDAASLLTPNLSIAFELNEHTELYTSWGAGFHSNDVRGVTISVDPADLRPTESVDLFVNQQGAEIGARVETETLNVTANYFWLQSDSELLFVGDSGATEPADGSRRVGIELSSFWQISDAWTSDLLATWVDSRFVGTRKRASNIPNAYGRVIGAGITYGKPTGDFVASLRARHFGDASLVEDGSIATGATTILNLGVKYRWRETELGLQLLNVLDAADNDIAYYFESQLAGEAQPVADVHFHPVLARTVRLSMKWML